jgi:transcription initiation factor TFIID TATA-box-binding protein
MAERRKIEPKFQNAVATIDIKKKLDLINVAEEVSNSIYEPDQFPGLIYKALGGSTCLIFASGKVVIVGTKSELQLLNAVDHIVKKLKQFEIST